MTRNRSRLPALVLIAAIATLMLHAPLPALAEAAKAAKSTKTAKPAKPAPSRPTATCDRARFHIVLDVGHTQEVPGALSARGVTEYDFNLRLARDIAKRLSADGFARAVVLVTAGPARPGLVKRVARANAMHADLFLSIHHDSVPEPFKEKWVYEEKESLYCDRFTGHSIFVSIDHGNYGDSLLFARLLGSRMKANGMQYTPHYTEKFMGTRRRVLVDAEVGVYRYDQLQVLRGTRMPAVLLEAGMIINRDEEVLLATPARREVIAKAVSEAAAQFCAARFPEPVAKPQPEVPVPRTKPAKAS